MPTKQTSWTPEEKAATEVFDDRSRQRARSKSRDTAKLHRDRGMWSESEATILARCKAAAANELFYPPGTWDGGVAQNRAAGYYARLAVAHAFPEGYSAWAAEKDGMYGRAKSWKESYWDGSTGTNWGAASARDEQYAAQRSRAKTRARKIFVQIRDAKLTENDYGTLKHTTTMEIRRDLSSWYSQILLSDIEISTIINTTLDEVFPRGYETWRSATRAQQKAEDFARNYGWQSRQTNPPPPNPGATQESQAIPKAPYPLRIPRELVNRWDAIFQIIVRPSSIKGERLAAIQMMRNLCSKHGEIIPEIILKIEKELS